MPPVTPAATGRPRCGPAANFSPNGSRFSPRPETVNEILGVEGIAARDYFAAMPYLLTDSKTWHASGRTKRPPTDPLNCLLSFLYGLLRVAVQGALEQVGSILTSGSSTAYDRVSPHSLSTSWKSSARYWPTVSRSTCSTGGNLPRRTSKRCPTAVTSHRNRSKAVISAWQQSRQREWPHHQLDRDVPAALLPLVQARLLARHLRGDLAAYQPWTVN